MTDAQKYTGAERLPALERFGALLADCGSTPAEVLTGILAYNAQHCVPPLDFDQSQVDAAARRLAATPPLLPEAAAPAWLIPAPAVPAQPANRFRMRMAGDISLENLPDFLIDDIIVENSIHAFYGATQAGKTFAALDMAMCVATGRPWFGHDTLPAAVLWLAAEDSFGVDKRARAWIEHNGTPAAPFATLDGAEFRIRDAATQDGIVERAEQLLAATGMTRLLIVADTLSKMAAGVDENSGKDSSEVMAAFDNLRRRLPTASICIIHHSGKSEGAGLRGHSSFGQGIDSFALVRKTAAGHTIEFEKVKNSELPPKIGFSLEGVVLGHYKNGKEIKSCVVLARDMKPIEVGPLKTPEAARTCLEALVNEAKDDGVPLPQALTGAEDTMGAGLDAWRAAYKNHHCNDGVSAGVFRKRWKDTRELLLKYGQVTEIETNGEKYYFAVDTS